MAIYSSIESIKRLTNSSLTSLIDITNLNFKSLSNATLEFLNNINYNEITNSINLYSGTFELAEVTTRLTVSQSSVPTFTIESSGNAIGKSLLVEVAETQRQRFTDFPDYPTIGVPGEIVYTGAQGLDPVFGEDFIGFLQTRGWVSLTGDSGGGGTAMDAGHKKLIESDELLVINSNYQYWIYGDFTVEGQVNNNGELVIANGDLILNGTGAVTNYGAGVITLVNLSTGDNIRVFIESFTATANTPVVINHGLGTSDFIYNVNELNEPIQVNLEYTDDDNVTITSTGDITSGTLIIHAKI